MAQQKETGQTKPTQMERSEKTAQKTPARYGTPFSGGSPFSLMRRMMEDFDRMFEDPFRGLMGGGGLGGGMRAPAIDVFERGDQIVVRADVPGFNKEDIKLECTEEGLIVEGERKDEREEKDGGFYRRERTYGTFRRLIPLPTGVDYDKVRAEMKDGVLEVCIPLPEEQKTQRRRIEISGSEAAGKTEKKSVH